MQDSLSGSQADQPVDVRRQFGFWIEGSERDAEDLMDEIRQNENLLLIDQRVMRSDVDFVSSGHEAAVLLGGGQNFSENFEPPINRQFTQDTSTEAQSESMGQTQEDEEVVIEAEVPSESELLGLSGVVTALLVVLLVAVYSQGMIPASIAGAGTAVLGVMAIALIWTWKSNT